MTIVTHEQDDGVFAEAVIFKMVKNLPHPIICCGDHFRIASPGFGEILVARVELGIGLFWVVGDIECYIEKKGIFWVIVDEFHGTLGDEVGEILILSEDLFFPLVEIMKPHAVHCVMPVVIDEATAKTKKLIEPLFCGAVIKVRA